MRKLALLFIGILFLISNKTLAQSTFATDRGSLELGGSIYFSSRGGEALEDTEGKRVNQFSLHPEFMIFIIPSFAIGGEVQFSTYSSSDYSSNTFGVGPSITYYIAGHREQKLYPYVGVSYLFSSQSYDYSSGTSNDSRTSTSIFKLGLMIMLSDAVALNTEFNYRAHTYNLGDNPQNGNDLYLGVGIKAFIF